MKREDIEKAAKEYRETLPYCDDAKIRGMSVGGEIGFIAGVKMKFRNQSVIMQMRSIRKYLAWLKDIYPQGTVMVSGIGM